MFAKIFAILLIPLLSYLGHSNSMSASTTFALIKPDAFSNTQDILKDIEEQGFKIKRKKHIKLSKNQAKQFYIEHSGRGFYDELVEFMTSGPITALALEREDAVQHWRSILGSTDSNEAREIQPGSIRAKYGKDKQQNACHGSDSEESAIREINFFFQEAEFNLITDDIEATRFLEQYIYPVLTEGLEQLMKISPKDPIKFLGTYLMEHAP